MAHAPGPVGEACARAAGAVTTRRTFGLCLPPFRRGKTGSGREPEAPRCSPCALGWQRWGHPLLRELCPAFGRICTAPPATNTLLTHPLCFPARRTVGATAREPPTSTKCATPRSAQGPTRISVPSSAQSATPTTPTSTASMPGCPTSITMVSSGGS